MALTTKKQLMQIVPKILSNSFTAEVEKAPAKLQLEVCKFKEDHFLLLLDVDYTLEFWKLVPSSFYANLK